MSQRCVRAVLARCKQTHFENCSSTTVSDSSVCCCSWAACIGFKYDCTFGTHRTWKEVSPPAASAMAWAAACALPDAAADATASATPWPVFRQSQMALADAWAWLSAVPPVEVATAVAEANAAQTPPPWLAWCRWRAAGWDRSGQSEHRLLEECAQPGQFELLSPCCYIQHPACSTAHRQQSQALLPACTPKGPLSLC